MFTYLFFSTIHSSNFFLKQMKSFVSISNKPGQQTAGTSLGWFPSVNKLKYSVDRIRIDRETHFLNAPTFFNS